MADVLNIRDIFEFVCYDCIDIILDYIDTPYDILKIIYYNKYHLYDLSRNDNHINKTTDHVQLLLYKKFYDKAIKNLGNFCGKSGVEWSDIAELLDSATILAGGSVLQSFYGSIDESTEIPLDFYYDEYLDIYPKIHCNSLKYFIERYAAKKTATVCTDMDIFKLSDIDIFSSNGIVEYSAVNYTDLGVCDLYRTVHDNYIMVIHIDFGYGCHNSDDNFNLSDLDNKITKIIGNEKCDVYIEVVDKTHSLFSMKRVLPIDIDEEEDVLYKFALRDLDYDGEELNDTTTFYKIIDKKDVYDRFLTRKNIRESIRNHKKGIVEVSEIPKIIENCRLSCIKSGFSIEGLILKNGDKLMGKIQKNDSFVEKKKHKPEKYGSVEKRESGKYRFVSNTNLAYDSLEAYHANKQWRESMYDPLKYSENINIDSCDKNYDDSCWENDDQLVYHIMFNTDTEKKIVPIAHPIGDGLMLNLIYINPSIFTETKKYIENFDINICKQSFNGKKLTLHSVSDLIHRRFKYNINRITDIDTKDNIYKYICFRKRVEKYKARGFTFLNEIEVINKVKNLMGINNMGTNIGELKKKGSKDNNLKKYYENIIKNFLHD